ncbi:methyl-accepting chemotaxis protein [Sphaerotilaceae bacterium SBD11-9]
MSQTAKEYVIDDSDLLVLMGDQAGNFMYANPAYLRASGYEWSELKGTQSARMLHKDNPPQVMKDMILTIRGKQPWTGIIKNRRKNGDYYWLRLNISPVFAPNGAYAGSLMVHSKPGAGEVAQIEPLYKRMLDGSHKNLMLRHGKAFTANAWGKAMLWMRETGLKGRVWSAMAALNVVGISGLLATNGHLNELSFWVAAGSLTALTGVIGTYLHRSVVLPLRETARFANKIAAGDLGSQMISNRSDEIGAVIRALSQMNVNMRATVLDVRDGAGLMKRATAEIATGTLDLSSRTESQASSLQQTAASMEQMNVTVRNNSETARQASQVAATACTAAESGGKVMGEMIATMEVITKSSKQISEIIGVIDSIAFQTNILALNAAVEAARAGEQGRGFAVVAAEVRSLAQRSAQSAKEIRTLISQSVDTVEGGSKLVNSAGQTIEDVVHQVRRVTELVNHIASASSEQSSGIGQISQAVVTLDHMTQQNAALVEESTASAESLREQAVRLVDVMGVFKLSQKETTAMFNATDAAAAEAARVKTAREVGLKG